MILEEGRSYLLCKYLEHFGFLNLIELSTLFILLTMISIFLAKETQSMFKYRRLFHYLNSFIYIFEIYTTFAFSLEDFLSFFIVF